ncbi:MAG: hypothetical protein KIS81_05325 [Maricaulaceae bacterium]|nr:hypothetical protein [Maricaulaceae bacterium]
MDENPNPPILGNPSQVAVDYSNSNVSLPIQGYFSVTARDASGIPVSLASFPWTRNGSVAVIDDAYAASQWLQQLPQNVDSLDFETVEFLVQPQPGVNILMAEFRYDSTTLGVTAEVWTQGGAGGCQGDQSACIE